MDKLWKAWEREVAGWIGSRRNPLSGSNNVSDSGKGRLGDIIHPSAVIECKLRKSVSVISMMRGEYRKAKKEGKTFVGVVREKGKKDLICLVLPYEEAKRVLRKIGGIPSKENPEPQAKEHSFKLTSKYGKEE